MDLTAIENRVNKMAETIIDTYPFLKDSKEIEEFKAKMKEILILQYQEQETK